MVNSVNMPSGISRERVQQYQNRHLRQIERAAKQWEARESKAKNNALRKGMAGKTNQQQLQEAYSALGGNFLIPIHEIENKLKSIKAFVFDWDGVLPEFFAIHGYSASRTNPRGR